MIVFFICFSVLVAFPITWPINNSSSQNEKFQEEEREVVWMSTLFADDDGGGSPSGDVAEGVDVDDLVALGQELGDFGIVLDRILVLHRYNLDVGVFRAARPVGHVIEGQDAGHFLFLHSFIA